MKKYLLSFSLSLIFFLIGVFTLSDYGINWDAPNRMIRGQVFLDYLLFQKPDIQPDRISPILIKPREYASRFDLLEGEEGSLVSLSEHPIPQKYKGNYFNDGRYLEFFSIPWGHPPLQDIFSALTNRIFKGILGEINSYQIANLLLSSVAVFVAAIFTFELSGSIFASIIAGISLALFPYFFAEAHFNMKDPIQSAMFSGAVWGFYNWVKLNKIKWFWISLGFSLIAFGIKWNIVFLPLILGSWLFLIRKSPEFKLWFQPVKLLGLSVLLIFLICILLLIIWPGGLTNPFGVLSAYLNYYLSTGTRADPLQPAGFILPGGFNIYPLILILTQTPEVILIFAFLGSIWALKQKGEKLKGGVLLLLWLFIPILRISLPHIWFYNGLRQFMEVIPVLAILSGIGASYGLTKTIHALKFKEQPRKKVLEILFTLIALIGLMYPLIKYHPNQNTYFNILVGGFKGATEKGLVDKKITYGNVYKEAAEFLNQNAPQNSKIALLDGPMFALSPLYLRDDLSISPLHFSLFEAKGEYIVLVNDFGTKAETTFASIYPQKILNPVHEIKVDGVNLLSIYQNSPQFRKNEYGSKELDLMDLKIRNVANSTGSYLEIDLGREVPVTKIRLQGVVKNCQDKYSQYIDEFVEFDSGNKYGLQERQKVPGGMEFLFPAEKTRFIKISPISNSSCFITTIISSVSYLSN